MKILDNDLAFLMGLGHKNKSTFADDLNSTRHRYVRLIVNFDFEI